MGKFQGPRVASFYRSLLNRSISDFESPAMYFFCPSLLRRRGGLRLSEGQEILRALDRLLQAAQQFL